MKKITPKDGFLKKKKNIVDFLVLAWLPKRPISSRNRLSETPLLILFSNRQSKDCEINLLKSRVEILEDQLDAVKETQKTIQERNQVCTLMSVRLWNFKDGGS